MRPRKMTVGTRVRAKVRTMGGWKGTGTIAEAYGTCFKIDKDSGGRATMFWDEIAVMNDQTPLDIHCAHDTHNSQ